jgi:hypothetical protein
LIQWANKTLPVVQQHLERARSIVAALKYIVSARACFHEALVHTIGPNGAVIRSMSAEYPAAIVIGRDAIR